MTFFEAIAGPLALLLRAAADWLDDEFEEIPEPPLAEAPKPLWKINARGGVDPIEE